MDEVALAQRPTDSVMEPSNSVRPTPRISDLFNVPGRYLRSVHLERDFDDAAALQHYIVTPSMVAVFSRILEGLRPASGQRAWRITGDYGTGKSSFALVLAHLLRDPHQRGVEAVYDAVARGNDDIRRALAQTRLLPLLVTGARERLVPAISGAVIEAIGRLRAPRRRRAAEESLRAQAAQVAESGDVSQLISLLEALGDYSSRLGYPGILLVLDELGKFLEYAALNPDGEDVYVLQRIAEVAARSGDHPLMIVGLLHQGFHAYSEGLPSAARLEWAKVAGRFEEVTFDQPLVHAAALIAGALNIGASEVPAGVTHAAQVIREATLPTGWYGTSGAGLEPLSVYPLHPTVLPVLVRFFARFGQHERSLFSFLLSTEPFGLQFFADQVADGTTWYRLSDFYDYIRSAFGYRLGGASYRSSWLRIVETLDRLGAEDIGLSELEILKTVAVLNLLDAEHLLPTVNVLTAAIGDGDASGEVRMSLETLRHRGLLFDRGAAGGYCLWPGTSVNLETAVDAATRALAPIDRVAPHLKSYLDQTPIVTRRHYIETGTLRHFEVRYAEVTEITEALGRPSDADGIVLIVLCESSSECQSAIEAAADDELKSRDDLLIGISPPLHDVRAELEDARRWQWILGNMPELGHDTYAGAEVARQLAESRRALQTKLSGLFGLQGGTKSILQWYRHGARFDLPERGRLPSALSSLCDELYSEAPQIRNELLNRQVLSSAASAARLRLIELMFSSAEKPNLGIEAGKAPPEKSMYLSVLAAGNVHREEDGHFVVREPREGADALQLRPALGRITSMLEYTGGHLVRASDILNELQRRPFGVRAGLAPLLLAIVAVAHSHEIAVYEHGTFLRRFGASEFLRLMKQPAIFEFQLCRVVGVRAEIFSELANVFATQRPSNRQPELLDIVQPLSSFVASLPYYTQNCSSLADTTQRVRQALMAAREPATLLFVDLPAACGLAPFTEEDPMDTERVQLFISALRSAIDDLRSAYPLLLQHVRDQVVQSLSDGPTSPDRTTLVERASRVLLAARERRIQTFARTLADTALPDDAWAERIGSFVLSKAMKFWTASDEASALDEIELLAGTFRRIEAIAFAHGGPTPDLDAVRLGLTLANGTESFRLVRFRPEDEGAVQDLTNQLQAQLKGVEKEELQIAALVRMLESLIPLEATTDV